MNMNFIIIVIVVIIRFLNKSCHTQLAWYKVNSKLKKFIANTKETWHVHKIKTKFYDSLCEVL